MKELKFFNHSSMQVMGIMFLAAFPFLYFDLNSGDYEKLFNKIATLAALSALVISIFNEASTNFKIRAQNVRSRLESKIDNILRQFENITFDFRHPNGIPGHSRGFHAFRIAMGDLLAGAPTLNPNSSNFSFWEAQIVLDRISVYLDEINNAEADIGDQYKSLVLFSVDCITPLIHIYQEFYNQYLSMVRRGIVANPELLEAMTRLYKKMNEIRPKYERLKNI